MTYNTYITNPANLDGNPYYYSSMLNIYTPECVSGDFYAEFTVTQTVAPTGYALDSTPRTYTCNVDGIWDGLDDGNVHYVMQPLVTTTNTPTAPALTTSANGITIPSTTGVKYLVNGTVTPAGDHPFAAGTYTITARALSGYSLPTEATSSWSLTIAATTASPPPAPATGLAATGQSLAPYIAFAVGALALPLAGVAARFRR